MNRKNTIHIRTTLIYFLWIYSLSLLPGQGVLDLGKAKTAYRQAFENKEYAKAESALQQIANQYYDESNFDSCYLYQQKRAELGVLTRNINLELDARFHLTNIDDGLQKKRPEEILQERRNLLTKLDTVACVDSIIASVYGLMAQSMKKGNQLDSAIFFNQLSTKYYYKARDFTKIVFNNLFLAGLYKSTHQYDQAIKTLMMTEGILNADPYLEDVVRIRFFRELSSLLGAFDDVEKAAYYLDKAKKLSHENKYELFEAQTQYDLSILLVKQEKYKEAKEALMEAIPYFEEKNMISYVKKCLQQKANIEVAQGDYAAFNTTFNDYIAAYKQADFPMLYYQAVTRLRQQNPEPARNLLHNLTNFSIPSSFELPIQKLKFEFQKFTGNYPKAMDELLTYMHMQDSLKTLRQSMVVHRMEGEFNRKAQDEKIIALHEVTIAKDKALAIRNTAIIIGTIFIVILGVLIFFLLKLYRKNLENQRQLSLQNIQITKALETNQVLLQEIHHRVKNNLQIISSLLNLQERKTEDTGAKDALKSSKTRVESMSILHQNLYQGEDLSHVHVDSYLDQLVKNVRDTYDVQGNIDFHVDIDPIALDIDLLIPLGLITNELITNALKHAFVGSEKGNLWVSLKSSGDKYTLTVADDGVGLPEKSLPINTKSLGAKLVQSFANRINAELRIDNEQGTRVEIIFDKNNL